MRIACIARSLTTLKQSFWNFNVAFGEDSAQDCILTIVETCKKATDQGKEYAPLLTNLSKAFDCLAHDLVIGKLHAYGLSMEIFLFNGTQIKCQNK